MRTSLYLLSALLLAGGTHTLTADILYSVTDLGDLGGYAKFGNTYTLASGINDAGQVTGYAATAAGQNHAFLYTNGQMQDLGTLGCPTSYGNRINNQGQITGSSCTSNGIDHAFLYTNGQMQDLNNLIDPTLQVTLVYGAGTNDNGQIIADGNVNRTESHAYLLTPVPEPSTLGPVRPCVRTIDCRRASPPSPFVSLNSTASLLRGRQGTSLISRVTLPPHFLSLIFPSS